MMRLIARLFPEEFPYHPNWKAGLTHPAFAARSATLDHVVPIAEAATHLIVHTRSADNTLCGIMPVIKDHAPFGLGIMPDHVGDRGAVAPRSGCLTITYISTRSGYF